MDDLAVDNDSSVGGSQSPLRKQRSYLGSSSSIISTTQNEFELMKKEVGQIQKACSQIDRLYNIKRSGTPAEQKSMFLCFSFLYISNKQLTFRSIKEDGSNGCSHKSADPTSKKDNGTNKKETFDE